MNREEMNYKGVPWPEDFEHWDVLEQGVWMAGVEDALEWAVDEIRTLASEMYYHSDSRSGRHKARGLQIAITLIDPKENK